MQKGSVSSVDVKGELVMVAASYFMLGYSTEHEWGAIVAGFDKVIPSLILSALGYLSQIPKVCLFQPGSHKFVKNR